MTDQLEPLEQQQPIRVSQGDSALIKEIYELKHSVSINNDPAQRLRLKELSSEAEKRKLL